MISVQFAIDFPQGLDLLFDLIEQFGTVAASSSASVPDPLHVPLPNWSSSSSDRV